MSPLEWNSNLTCNTTYCMYIPSFKLISKKTRRSENDNTPQPLDQWTNSPFMGNRLETARVSHWPITWPIYLPCTVTQEQAHHESDIVSNSHLFYSKSINLPIPKIWLFKIWPWKSKVKFMGEVKVLSHNLSPTSYRLTFFWFHVNSPSYCYDKAFFKFCLQNPRSKS